ncbi:dTDP-4-dehydrorhamnose reductase [Lysobacter sp. A3-1-A15]|uniref:dTDP-4-dehydrorhamnose reductase n=1 Tax=Novilysobacter viscosus TaxID=3098602 RepID=UPI002ED9CABA
MRVLLLGANGQVGTELRRSLPAVGEVIPATRSGQLPDGTPCEAVDLAALATLPGALGRIRPDVVVNAAAYTAVDRAESEAERAYRINAEAPGLLAGACREEGIALVHYSTDYVFDGRGLRPYREDDRTDPQNVYGASKLAGEQAITASGAEHLILRTAWVYGLHGHNFLRTMLRLGAERDALDVVDDQRGCPTPSWLIADATASLLGADVPANGIVHLVATGETSWHGFAQAIFEDAVATGRLEHAPDLRPVPSSHYPTPVRRPAYSVLDTLRLQGTFGVGLPHWREALARTMGPRGPQRPVRRAGDDSVS